MMMVGLTLLHSCNPVVVVLLVCKVYDAVPVAAKHSTDV